MIKLKRCSILVPCDINTRRMIDRINNHARGVAANVERLQNTAEKMSVWCRFKTYNRTEPSSR